MDCEKFESAMIDELYDELDELTSAAAKRHVAGCARCAAMLGGLRATRRVLASAGGVPLVEPPATLEARILAATREAEKVIPFRRRVSEAISAAGSWAMRPQTAMAALFLLMIGSSVVFLRGGKKAPEAASAMRVTEQGAPAASVAALDTNEMLDPGAAKGAHGAPAAAPAATAVAMASAAPAGPADDERSRGVMDSLLGGKARGEGTGALAQALDDNGAPKEEEKLGGLNAIRNAGGGIGGAGDPSTNGYGYGSGGAANAPARRAAASPPPPPAAVAAQPAAPASKAARADGYDAPLAAATATAAPTDVAKDKKADGDSSNASAFDAARQQLAQHNYAEATRQFDALAQAGDPNAALWAARAVRDGSGCGAALSRYDAIIGRQAGTSAGNDALLEGGQCYRMTSQFEAARARLVRLLAVPTHAARAQRELDAMMPKAAAKPAPRKAPEPSQQQAPAKDNSAF